MSRARLVIDEDAWQEVRRAIGRGALRAAFALERAAKANAPVRGGHRTFNPDQRIGGTLRRSITSVVYVDGMKVGASPLEQGARPLTTPPPGPGIVAQVGSALEYALYVHDGTVHMPERPFLAEAAAEVGPRIKAIVGAELPPGWVVR